MLEARITGRDDAAIDLSSCERRANEWILNPVCDLLFCCGGLLWILFGLHYYVFGTFTQNLATQTLVVLVIVGTHLLSETHNVATLFRIYETGENRAKFSFYSRKVIPPCLVLLLAGLSVPGAASIFAKIYLLLVTQHFMAQSYGIALLYCAKRGYHFGPREKKVFFVMMQATAAYAVVRQLTLPEWGSGKFMGVNIPFWGPLPVEILQMTEGFLAGAVVCFTVVVVKKLIYEKRMFPWPALLLVITGISIFIMSKEITGTLWLYVPAFYHGSQYLLVSAAFYFKEKKYLQSSSPELSSEQPRVLKYFALLLLCGTFVYIGVPRILEQTGVNYAIAFTSIFTVINFHHFLTDRAIWKLKDKRTREILLA